MIINIFRRKAMSSALAAMMTLAGMLCSGTASAQEFRMPEDPSAFATEEVHFQSGGKDLFGMRFTPKSGKAAGKSGRRMPAVIMSHGYNGNPVLFYELIDSLARKGYICYFFDFSGGSDRTRSEGSFSEMSVLTEKQNLEDAIRMIRGWKNVDRKNIFLVGESQGGIVSSLAAADKPGWAKALALMYPAFVIPDDAREAFSSKDEIPETTQFLGHVVGRQYYADVYDMDIYSIIPRFKGNVLIVHGDKDTLVPIEYSKKALDAYRHATLKVIPGAPHGFFFPEYSHMNVRWISEFLDTETKR